MAVLLGKKLRWVSSFFRRRDPLVHGRLLFWEEVHE